MKRILIRVREEDQPVAEPELHTGETLEITEAAGTPIAPPVGSKWRVRVFEYGLSKNKYKAPGGGDLPLCWTPQSGKAAIAVLEGARCFADHAPEGKGQSVRNLIGFYSDPQLGPKGPEATLTVLESEEWAQRKMLAAWKIGRPLGFSIDAVIGVGVSVNAAGARALDVEEIAAIKSVDLVSTASSGGAALAVLENQQDPGGNPSGKPGSADGAKTKGATMKQTIVKILESLRALAGVGEKWTVEATAIETELKKDAAELEPLMTRASEAFQNAAAEISAQGGKAEGIDEQIETLNLKVAEANRKQSVAEAKHALHLAITEQMRALPVTLQKQVREDITELLDDPDYDPKKVTKQFIDGKIKRVRENYAPLAQGKAKISLVPATVGLESSDKLQIAMHKLIGVTHDWKRVEEGQMTRWVRGEALDSTVPGFRGILEAYIHFTGDRDVTGIVDPEKMRHVSEDWLPAGFANALGSSLTRMLLQGYAEPTYGMDILVPQGNRKAIRDFKTQERVRVGYFGDLPVVDTKVSDVPELSAPTDEKATYSVVSFQGMVTIHRETLIDDDLGFINDTAAKLGRTARRTLAQRYINLLTANAATTYDSQTWFHASLHGANLRTTALSATELEAVSAAMFAQTEKDSGKAIGIEPSILVVPRALKAAAYNANQYQPVEATGNPTWHKFGVNNERIVVSPLLTDVTDFYTFADQNEVPCVELGILQGRQEPELFLADGPTTERVFTGDRIRYKVRHEYEFVVIDHRGASRNTVAG